jgi:hypothetical protein
MGHGQNFIGGWCSEEQGKADGFPWPNRHKWVGLRNGSRPRRSEADTLGPQDVGARLPATRGMKWRGLVWRNWLG